jgi:hypothetical protein
MAGTYPTGVRVYIDGIDCTAWIFGSDTINPSDVQNEYEDINISSYLHGVGTHTIEITCDAGVGKVEARIEVE